MVRSTIHLLLPSLWIGLTSALKRSSPAFSSSLLRMIYGAAFCQSRSPLFVPSLSFFLRFCSAPISAQMDYWLRRRREGKQERDRGRQTKKLHRKAKREGGRRTLVPSLSLSLRPSVAAGRVLYLIVRHEIVGSNHEVTQNLLRVISLIFRNLIW